MKTESQCYRVSVVRHDGPLRFLVPSRRRGEAPYLVELDSYPIGGGRFAGQCNCKHYAMRLEPLLRRGYTPERAIDEGLVRVPPWGTVESSLSCFHIHVARLKFADDVVDGVHRELQAKANAVRGKFVDQQSE